MIENNRRLAYLRAKEYGDEVEEFVTRETGNWGNPVVSTAEVAEEFDLDEGEVVERLNASQFVNGKSVGETRVWW